jgi:hypothetical protein
VGTVDVNGVWVLSGFMKSLGPATTAKALGGKFQARRASGRRAPGGGRQRIGKWQVADGAMSVNINVCMISAPSGRVAWATSTPSTFANLMVGT